MAKPDNKVCFWCVENNKKNEETEETNWIMYPSHYDQFSITPSGFKEKKTNQSIILIMFFLKNKIWKSHCLKSHPQTHQ
jgi:hypothetical protein